MKIVSLPLQKPFCTCSLVGPPQSGCEGESSYSSPPAAVEDTVALRISLSMVKFATNAAEASIEDSSVANSEVTEVEGEEEAGGRSGWAFSVMVVGLSLFFMEEIEFKLKKLGILRNEE